jgi:hypothetical protein
MPEYVVKLADGPGAVCSLVSEVFAEDDVLSDDGEASLEVDVADLGGKPVAQPKLLERFVGLGGHLDAAAHNHAPEDSVGSIPMTMFTTVSTGSRPSPGGHRAHRGRPSRSRMLIDLL